MEMKDKFDWDIVMPVLVFVGLLFCAAMLGLTLALIKTVLYWFGIPTTL
jgi:hypothetical protein